MNSLNIDFRDGCLRVLVLKDGSVRYSKLVRSFSVDDGASVKDMVTSEIKKAGWKKGRTNIILPADIVKQKTHHVPALNSEDTKKIIHREISKELRGERFTFGIRKMFKQNTADAAGQEVLAEYVSVADVSKYLNFLKGCGIKPDCMISSLEGNLHFFNRFRPKTDGSEALLDIGMDVIEIAVFNSGHLTEYEKVSISHGDADPAGSKTTLSEHADKIRTYKIVEVLYNFLVSSKKDSPEQKLSTIWICGIGSLTEGIADSVSEGLGVNCRVTDLSDTIREKGSEFAALSGVALLSRKDDFINFIPGYMLEEKTKLLRRALLAASLSIYLLLLIGGYSVLNHTENTLKLAYGKAQSEQASRAESQKSDGPYFAERNTFAKIVSGRMGLYAVLRDIANRTPQGVVLESMEVQKAQERTNLKIIATIQYNDKNVKDALLSKFLSSLDTSLSLRRTSNPEILLRQSPAGQKTILIKVLYEVHR